MRVLLVFLQPSLHVGFLILRTIRTPAVTTVGRGAAATSPLVKGVLHRALVVTIHADLEEDDRNIFN